MNYEFIVVNLVCNVNLVPVIASVAKQSRVLFIEFKDYFYK